MSDSRTDRIPLSLLLFLGLCITAALPDLSDASIVEIRDANGRAVLNGEFRSRTDAFGNVEKDAALTDRRGQPVVGEVEIEIPGPNSPTQDQELEIDIIHIASRGKFALFIDDREILNFISDDRGSIDMEVTSSGALVNEAEPRQ
jgi:hypothetical protein